MKLVKQLYLNWFVSPVSCFHPDLSSTASTRSNSWRFQTQRRKSLIRYWWSLINVISNTSFDHTETFPFFILFGLTHVLTRLPIFKEGCLRLYVALQFILNHTSTWLFVCFASTGVIPVVGCFVLLYVFSTDCRISTHCSLLISNPSNRPCIIFLMVCTIHSENGGGVLVIICLILFEFIHLINGVELHEPSLSWYTVFITPILSNTSLNARIDSAGFLSLIGTAWHILVKISTATTTHICNHCCRVLNQ